MTLIGMGSRWLEVGTALWRVGLLDGPDYRSKAVQDSARDRLIIVIVKTWTGHALEKSNENGCGEARVEMALKTKIQL